MRKFLMTVLSLGLMGQAFASPSSSPAGLWRTIDDVTGKPKAIIRIAENKDHHLSGEILKIYPRPGYDQNEVCEHCEGALHNQRIVGMTILHGLKPDPDNRARYIKGDILDPNNGKTYHCNVLLMGDNQQLQVRGYIGVPLFGRSQTWVRVKEGA